MALGPRPSLARSQVTSQTLTFSVAWNAEIRVEKVSVELRFAKATHLTLA